MLKVGVGEARAGWRRRYEGGGSRNASAPYVRRSREGDGTDVDQYYAPVPEPGYGRALGRAQEFSSTRWSDGSARSPRHTGRVGPRIV